MITTEEWRSTPGGTWYKSTFRLSLKASLILSDTTECSRLIDQASACVHRVALKWDTDREATLRLIHFACVTRRRAVAMMAREEGR